MNGKLILGLYSNRTFISHQTMKVGMRVDDAYYLDAFQQSDTVRLAEIINDPEISRNTLAIPYPYTLEDAEWWLSQVGIIAGPGVPQRNWAIRNSEGLVCGGIGRYFRYGVKSHKDEFGYWLMRPLWGQGLMTKVVKVFTDSCFEDKGLKRLEAPIFEFNKGSARVLVKAGFVCEGRLKNAYLKDGVLYDSLIYAKTV